LCVARVVRVIRFEPSFLVRGRSRADSRRIWRVTARDSVTSARHFLEVRGPFEA
jgi:hypothetical protein